MLNDDHMHYTPLLLGKNQLTDLKLEDLIAYFADPKFESDKVEYKSYPSALDKYDSFEKREKAVVKTICALLNSQGGILIWGSPTTQKNNESKESLASGKLEPVTKKIEKDAFIAKLANRITPSPKNVLFHRIEDNGNYIYIFDVSQSEHAPHQFENIYYMRMDGQTVAAPHAYIEALFMKIRYPHLEAFLTLTEFRPTPENEYILGCRILFRNCTPLINDENVYCEIQTTNGIIFIPTHGTQGINIGITNITEVISYGAPSYFHFRINSISKSILDQNDGKFELTITFGARFSPVRFSHYVIEVRHDQNIQHWVNPLMENVYIHELTDMGRKDDSKDEFLKKLGRLSL